MKKITSLILGVFIACLTLFPYTFVYADSLLENTIVREPEQVYTSAKSAEQIYVTIGDLQVPRIAVIIAVICLCVIAVIAIVAVTIRLFHSPKHIAQKELAASTEYLKTKEYDLKQTKIQTSTPTYSEVKNTAIPLQKSIRKATPLTYVGFILILAFILFIVILALSNAKIIHKDVAAMFLYILSALTISSLIGIIPGYVAHNKGYSFIGYWLFGWILFIPALIVTLVLPDLLAQQTYNTVSMAPFQTVSNFSAADEIIKYKKLLDDGIISEEEFQTKKKQLLKL